MKDNAGQEIKKLPPLVPKTPEAAQYHERVFLRKFAERMEQLARLPLTIFVCGPSEESNPLTKKRLDTVNALRNLGHNALMGEEIIPKLKEEDKQANRPIRHDNVYEREVALQSDVVVIFRASPGSTAEFHEFQSVPVIAHKTLVFADKAHEKGYSTTGALAMHNVLYGKVELYTSPSDIEKCILLGKTLQWIETFQASKWLQESGVCR